MGKYFDKDGNEVEAFSKDELETEKKTALDAYLKDHPDQSNELAEATKKVEDLTKQIEENGGTMTDGQKKRLLEDKKAAEDLVKTVTEKFTKEMGEFKESVFGGFRNKALNTLSGGDKEKAEKIQARYDSLMKTGDYKLDEEGIAKAMSEAATLVNGAAPKPGWMDNMTSSGAGGAGQVHKGAAGADSPNAVAIGNMLGVTDADRAKYPTQGDSQEVKNN